MLFSSVVVSLPRVDATSKNHLKTSLHCVSCMLRLHQSAASSDSPCSSGCAHYICSYSSTEAKSPSKSSHTLGPASSKLWLIHETSLRLQMSLMAPGKVSLFPKVSSLVCPHPSAVLLIYNLVCFLKLGPEFWNYSLYDRMDAVHGEGA